jgi:hypothetical protein
MLDDLDGEVKDHISLFPLIQALLLLDLLLLILILQLHVLEADLDADYLAHVRILYGSILCGLFEHSLEVLLVFVLDLDLDVLLEGLLEEQGSLGLILF